MSDSQGLQLLLLSDRLSQKPPNVSLCENTFSNSIRRFIRGLEFFQGRRRKPFPGGVINVASKLKYWSGGLPVRSCFHDNLFSSPFDAFVSKPNVHGLHAFSPKCARNRCYSLYSLMLAVRQARERIISNLIFLTL